MAGFLFLGILFLTFGFMFLFAPRLIIRLSELGNKLVYTDHGTVAHRYLTGIIMLAVSLLMFYLWARF